MLTSKVSKTVALAVVLSAFSCGKKKDDDSPSPSKSPAPSKKEEVAKVVAAQRKLVNFTGHVNLSLKTKVNDNKSYFMFFKLSDMSSADPEVKDLKGGVSDKFEFAGASQPGVCLAKISAAKIFYESLAFGFDLSATLSDVEITACNDFVTSLKTKGGTIKLINPSLAGKALDFDILLTIQPKS